jgi:hypothetical protein
MRIRDIGQKMVLFGYRIEDAVEFCCPARAFASPLSAV